MTEEYASSKMTTDVDDLNSIDDMWMTSTQFSHLLDKQEAAEAKTFEKHRPARFSTMSTGYSGSYAAGPQPPRPAAQLFRRSSIASSVTSGSSAYSRQNNNIHIMEQSFLDNDARVPFAKLKQVRLFTSGF